MTKKLSLITLALIASSSMVSAQQACETYTVRSGDSLSAIAREAYGSISFQRIWDANRDVIGDNPSLISVGMKLRMPCADGTLASDASVAAPAPAPAPAPVVESTQPVTLRLVTGSDYAPFTDEGMEGGGIYTQLVRAAMETMEPQIETDIAFINDWGSHLDTLLPSGAFDGAFPWLRPNCEAPETLTENSQFRCDNFLHSEPFYEIITGLITRADDPLVQSDDYADFHGKTICLPDGYTDAALSSGGLTEPTVTYFRPVNPDECFSAMVNGDVDAVALEFVQANDIAERLGYTDQVAPNEKLTVVNILAVFVDKTNPDAEVIISSLNQGLENIRLNGVWFQTVQSGFSAFYSNQ